MSRPIIPRRTAIGDGTEVTRFLPTRQRRTVGAWCFLDLYGPDDVDGRPGMRVGPHPHTGLQTVTWLLAGEVVHRDSLGTRQAIRPGQLNLMTAGAGIAHAEESAQPHPRWLHGLQLWAALPEHRREAAPSFQHVAEPPRVDVDALSATVFVGGLAGVRSTAVVHSPLVGADVSVPGTARSGLPVEPEFEHALVVVEGRVRVDGRPLTAGQCVYVDPGRDLLEVVGDPAGRLLLLGGQPFTEPLVMWWNFVGRTADDVAGARADWEAGRRFGEVTGAVSPPVPAPASCRRSDAWCPARTAP